LAKAKLFSTLERVMKVRRKQGEKQRCVTVGKAFKRRKAFVIPQPVSYNRHGRSMVMESATTKNETPLTAMLWRAFLIKKK